MNWFDAINHAMSTISTAGFSTKNKSVLFYDNLNIEVVISVFMVVGALPMTFYIVLLQNKFRQSLRTEQVVSFLKVLFVYIVGSSLWLVYKDVYGDFGTALRYASFNIISIVTTTGLTSVNYLEWGRCSRPCSSFCVNRRLHRVYFGIGQNIPLAGGLGLSSPVAGYGGRSQPGGAGQSKTVHHCSGSGFVGIGIDCCLFCNDYGFDGVAGLY